MTYRPSCLPTTWSLDKRDWQLFAKRLRKNIGPFRYFAVGEYGDLNLRPHLHAIIYGQDFHQDRTEIKATDEQLLKRQKLFPSPQQFPDHHSKTLEATWGLGDARLSDVTPSRCAYVARYTHKKQSKARHPEVYERTDAETGETWEVAPEFALMSKNLGHQWLREHADEVLQNDLIRIQGSPYRPPKSYEKTLEKLDSFQYHANLAKRREAVQADRYTPRALEVQERILQREYDNQKRPI